MRKIYPVLLIACAFAPILVAQPSSPDTLIVEPVIGDPISSMLVYPSGDDNEWINYDIDLEEGYCVDDDVTPVGWFLEQDYSFLDPNSTTNQAFTSCSYLYNAIRNNNWLILPPFTIPDANFQLCWRSLPFEAPTYMDGYRVVVSTASNLPESGDFSHVLFTAAETVKPIVPIPQGTPPSLDPADYLFSPGYIHANGLTDTNYFYLQIQPDGTEGPLRGKMEPHTVSLAEFAGQHVYVAFHHNSKDDNQIQIDDIVIARDLSTGTHAPDNFIDFNITPNPATSSTYVSWNMRRAEPGRLQLYDMTGMLVLEKNFSAYQQGQLYLELDKLNAGIYTCTLQTDTGKTSRKLVKI